MGTISVALITDITDRIAAQAQFLQSGLLQANQDVVDGRFFDRITESDDPDIELDLLGTYRALDVNFSTSEEFRRIFGTAVASLQNHVIRTTGRDMNTYFTTSGIQVAHDFARVFNASRGSELTANNTFGDSVDPMWTISFTGSGTGTSTDGGAVGTGGTSLHSDTATIALPKGNHGPEQLEVIVESGTATEPIQLDIQGKNRAGTIVNAPAFTIVAGNVTPGYTQDVGTSTDLFLDVTRVQFNGGASTDKIRIRSKVLRVVSL